MSKLARPGAGDLARGRSHVDAALTWPAIRRYYPALNPGKYLLALPERNLAYVKNPKAGCSTIVVWLDRLHTGDYDAELLRIHMDHRIPRVGELDRRLVRRMLSGDAYRFSFVRHPLRRFESVYWDKIVHSPNAGRFRRKVSAEAGLHPEATISFERFLTAVEQQDPVSGMDPHWRPQHVNLLHPLVEYDHVGHLETFDADLERIREEAGLPHVPWQRQNISRHTSGESVYDGRPDLVRRVEQLYAKDFELYGY